jgi:hypothetical protein
VACGSTSDSQDVEPASLDFAAVEDVGLTAGTNQVSLTLDDGTPMSVTIITPAGWEAGTSTPTVLALPGAGHSLRWVEIMTTNYIGAEAFAAGWVVISPAAPGELFYRDMSPLIQMLDQLSGSVVPEDGKVHVVEISAGGTSAFAFAFATAEPERVASVLTFPGGPEPTAAPRLSPESLCACTWAGSTAFGSQRLKPLPKNLRRLESRSPSIFARENLPGPDARS